MLSGNETLKDAIENLPSDWLRLTTHRLDIYNEKLAKVEFLEKFQQLKNKSRENLAELPTAFDYVRLGHPLSCILEWAFAEHSQISPNSVISFSSETMPVLAILRTNKLRNKKTRLVTKGLLPKGLDVELLKKVYGYELEVQQYDSLQDFPSFEGSTIVVDPEHPVQTQFILHIFPGRGSLMMVMDNDAEYVKEILHVRRRESIAMTPHDCLRLMKSLMGENEPVSDPFDASELVIITQAMTQTKSHVGFGSSGLSVQYAIMMGLVDFAGEKYPGKKIHFIVPPNCYGGTNDQARRVAATLEHVEIVDLPVDSGKDMSVELGHILDECAVKDVVPYIIAEIPTNPRVEVPDLVELRTTLKQDRLTPDGKSAVSPVFILDQTFCPNLMFFSDKGYLHDVSAISYVSGSKFPSGGLCTAGYCVANQKAHHLQNYVARHLTLCDNEANDFQLRVLSEQMPTMIERIASAYKNARGFVDFIREKLPEAKINFVSEELADLGFTPSVFSLDLPSRGETPEEKEKHKRQLNQKLIRMMIEAIPDESKHCVSYGQLKGCYWTIPATSTQGTTKESDKDYIVRVSVGAEFNLEKHKKVFEKFCNSL